MPIVKLANYQNAGFTYVNADNVMYFSEVAYNGVPGTELYLVTGKKFITSYFPEKVKELLEEADNGN